MRRFLFISLSFHVGLFLFSFYFHPNVKSEAPVEIELTTFKIQNKVSNIASTQKLKPSPSHTISAGTETSAFGDIKLQYLSHIHEQVKRQQSYPALSKKIKEQGLVKVQLTIDPSGSLKKIELVESSPFKRLNEAAIRAAARAAPFQPFPQGIHSELWTITIPVQFSLN